MKLLLYVIAVAVVALLILAKGDHDGVARERREHAQCVADAKANVSGVDPEAWCQP